MKDQQIIQFLWRYGHFRNPLPEFRDTWNVQTNDLPKMTLADREAELAVRSYQLADGNLVPLARTYHGRDPVEDGGVGPATLALMALPRCPVPDHLVDDHDRLFVPNLDPDLVKVYKSMMDWKALGSGGWHRDGCDPDHKNKGYHSIRVRINTSRAPQRVLSYIEEALKASVACYAEVGLHVRYIISSTNDAEILKQFEPLSGSMIGWNYFPQPNTCSKIQGRFDTDFAPSDMKYWANLEVHETGHGVGLEHTRGDIMNPSLLLKWPLTWKGSPSYPALKRMYGGEPISITPPTPPDPPTGSKKVRVVLDVDYSTNPPTSKVISTEPVGGDLLI